MLLTEKEKELINKYYSKRSTRSIGNRIDLQNHIYAVWEVSKDILELYRSLCSDISIVCVLSDKEIKAIKYASVFHDVGKTIKYKFDNEDRHIDNAIDIISSEDFKKEFKEALDIPLSDADINTVWNYMISAIRSHRTADLNENDCLSSFVSAVVFASDKIAHVKKKAEFKKRKRRYFKASKKINELIQEIQRKYQNDVNLELLAFCIAKTLLYNIPLKNDRWTVFGEKIK